MTNLEWTQFVVNIVTTTSLIITLIYNFILQSNLKKEKIKMMKREEKLNTYNKVFDQFLYGDIILLLNDDTNDILAELGDKIFIHYPTEKTEDLKNAIWELDDYLVSQKNDDQRKRHLVKKVKNEITKLYPAN